jgi:hypothetical protein
MRRSAQSIRNTRDDARSDDSVATDDAFLRPAAAAEFLQVTKGYLAKLRMAGGGGGPAWYRPEGTGLVLYRKSDLVAWLGNPRRSTVREERKTRDGGGSQ